MNTLPSVPIPVEVNRRDPVLFGLTAAQAAALGITGLLLWCGWTVLRLVTGPGPLGVLGWAYAAFSVVVLLVVAGIALGRREGMTLAAWLHAALAFRRAPRRLAPDLTATSADGRPGASAPGRTPPWLSATTGPQRSHPVAPWTGQARSIDAGTGLVDVGTEGTTGLAGAGTVCFGLRDSETKAALIAGFARWLHSIGPRTQILIRAHPVTLTTISARAATDGTRAATPQLARAAAQYAGFLTEVDGQFDLIERRIVIAVRDLQPAVAARRAGQAAADLIATGVQAAPLSAAGVHGVLRDVLHPEPAASPDQQAATEAGEGSW